MNSAISAEIQALVHDNLELISSFKTNELQKVHEAQWSYSEGGDDWYTICDHGLMQSPIVIDMNNLIRLNCIGESFYPFVFNYPKISNYGNFVEKAYQIPYTEGSVEYFTPQGDCKKYESVKIEVHAPAEHIIKGKQKALEMHVIHKDLEDNLFILAVLFKISPQHNSFIQEILDSQGADLAQLVGVKPEVYVYCGSLTYPPCAETVLWAICASTQRISFEQVKHFSSKWENNQAFARGHGNNRKTQELSNRIVFNFL